MIFDFQRRLPLRQDLKLFGLSDWQPKCVRTYVKSQTMHRPFAHGSTVRPSSRLPSSLDSEFGYYFAGTLADARARLIRSLTALCRT